MILDDILAHKREELAARPQERFRRMLEKPGLSLVCELKLKSPTHPQPFVTDPRGLLGDYKKAGVDAISVVTDQKYFGGSVDLVAQARATGLPVLRKDFVLNPTQITEVAADALLLIARILSPKELKHLTELCLELGIEPVVEINDEAELEPALKSGAKVIAVNSRDLQAQKIDLEAGLALLDQIPNDRLKMFFSGIEAPAELAKVKARGAHGVLIGTSILTAEDRLSKIKELKEAAR
jgi:indole-3-glycerol phosphate synthase